MRVRRNFLPAALLLVFSAVFAMQAAICSSGAEAQERRRVALVVGNDDYRRLRPLNNAVRDAKAVTELLRRHGFEIIEGAQNLALRDMHTKLAELRRAAVGAEVALFYYAGHGGNIGGRDLLAPVDMAVDCRSRTAEGEILLKAVEQAVAPAEVKLVILDACRNDLASACPSRGNLGDGFRGLGRVSSPNRIVASSTLEGALAGDGPIGGHSPFADALLRRLGQQPHDTLRRILDQVSVDVNATSGGQQIPSVTALAVDRDICLSRERCGTGTTAPTPSTRPRPPPPPVITTPAQPQRQFQRHVNRSIHGADLDIIADITDEACKERCRSDDRCLGYTYDKWNQKCFLKGEGGVLRFDPQYVTEFRADSPLPLRSDAGFIFHRYRG